MIIFIWASLNGAVRFRSFGHALDWTDYISLFEALCPGLACIVTEFEVMHYFLYN
jgi:hypothetical protein